LRPGRLVHEDDRVVDEPFDDDQSLIMEALIEIRHNVRRIVSLLEDEDGEEEEEDA
jgi:hypothetical protein